MITTFLATLNPMLTLFLCIALGFVLCKAKILPESACKVMAKLEVWLFCPALSFYTMAYYFTTDTISTHATNLILCLFLIALIIPLSYLLAPFFVRQKVYERNVYLYALAFANLGYVGEPVVDAVLGGEGLAFYKLFTLPLCILIYSWGVRVLVPSDKKTKNNPLSCIANAPTIAMFVGMIVGVTGLGPFLLGDLASQNYTFFGSTVLALKGCMGPVAMLLAGCTIASYPFKKMVTNVKVYLASVFRLIIIPIITVAFVFAVKTLANIAFGLTINNMVVHLTFFATATPLGLNTVVFPEAYGGDPSTGASMAMISHTLCVVTIPLMYALLCSVLPI